MGTFRRAFIWMRTARIDLDIQTAEEELVTNPYATDEDTDEDTEKEIRLKSNVEEYLGALFVDVNDTSWSVFHHESVLSTKKSVLDNIVARVMCHQVILRNDLRRIFCRYFSREYPLNIVKGLLRYSDLEKPLWNIFKVLAFLCEYRMYKIAVCNKDELMLYFKAFEHAYVNYISPNLKHYDEKMEEKMDEEMEEELMGNGEKVRPTKLKFLHLIKEARTKDSLDLWKVVESYINYLKGSYPSIHLNEMTFKLENPDTFFLDPFNNIAKAFKEPKSAEMACLLREGLLLQTDRMES